MEKGKYSLIAVVMVLLLIFGIGGSCVANTNDHKYIVTVTDKERINENKDSYYLIFCEDKDGNYYEFKNSDTLLRGKFDSSRVYNQIKIGKTYEFTVVGFRVPLFSWYQNIVDFKLIKE